VRENVKSEAVRFLTLGRKLLLEMGSRLCDRRLLEDREDIFFLRMEEIEPVRRQHSSIDVPQTIRQRRAEYEKNLAINPPAVVVGRFDPNRLTPEPFDPSARFLKGLGVSPGMVTGSARVILLADNREQVLQGEVLVAPFADPGWSPYFLQA